VDLSGLQGDRYLFLMRKLCFVAAILLVGILLVSSTPLKADEARELYLRGLREEDGEKAFLYFRRVVEKFPTSEFYDDAFIKVIEYAYSKGLYRKTIAYTHRMLKECPQSPLIKDCIYFQICSFNTLGMKDSVGYYLTLYEEKYPTVEIDFEGSEVKSGYILTEEAGFTGSEARGEKAQSGSESGREFFFLQVGAFSNLNNAFALRERLNSMGYHALVQKKRVKGKIFYVVKIGSFPSKREAMKFGKKFKKDTGINYLVVEN